MFLAIIGLMMNAVCIWLIKLSNKESKRISNKQYIKFLSGFIFGFILSWGTEDITFLMAIIYATYFSALLELLELFYISIKGKYKKETIISYYDDGSPARFFITGDKHRDFSRIKQFCVDMNTRKKDVLIILGDVGFNYYGDRRDSDLKREISELNITLFCLHGNKENRPHNIKTYGVRNFCGGKVYCEAQYPNIYFAIDGEIYKFEGKKYITVGGAHSIDKLRCIEEGKPYWEDEMPDDKIKFIVEHRLQEEKNQVYGVLTHTCPMDYIPMEMFMSNKIINKTKFKLPSIKIKKKEFTPDIDRSTEIWLSEIEKTIKYKIWFCGHYHVDKQIDKINMLYNDIRPLHMPLK